MKSPEQLVSLDVLLTEYAIQHLDWPDSVEELDEFLCAQIDDSIDKRISATVSVASPLKSAQHEPNEYPCRTDVSRQRFLFDLGETPSVRHQVNSRGQSASLPEIVRLAYSEVFVGYSIDKLIADPDRNARFIEACWKRGAQASQYELNRLLLNARKNRIIGKVDGVQPYRVHRDQMDQYLFACEAALRILQDEEYFGNQQSVSLDRILCDPAWASRFDSLAREIIPGFASLDYRWGALCIRKAQNRNAAKADFKVPSFMTVARSDSIRLSKIDPVAGLFWLSCDDSNLYIGHAANLRAQVERMLETRVDDCLGSRGLLPEGGFKRASFALAPFPDISSTNGEFMKAQLVRAVRGTRLNVLEKGLRVA